MPSESALTRAADQAFRVSEELRTKVALPAESWRRFDAVCQTWRYRDHQRPVLSLIVTKSETSPQKEPVR
jgi:hypothetical protein